MRRASVVVATIVTLTVAACGDDAPSLSSWCGEVASGAVVTLDSADAPTRWRDLEAAAPADLRADVERLRVAADQVAALDPDDLESAARLVITPRVLEAHSRVVGAIGDRCRIDVSTLSVIDQR